MKLLQRKNQEKIKLTGSKRTIFVLATAAVLLGVLLFYFYNQNSQNSSKNTRLYCRELSDSASEQLKQKKYQETYDQLKSQAAKCTTQVSKEDTADPSSAEQNATVLLYNTQLAKAAALSGDKQQAVVYADQAIEATKKMTPEQNKQIENPNKQFFELLKIKQGFYQGDIGEPQQ